MTRIRCRSPRLGTFLVAAHAMLIVARATAGAPPEILPGPGAPQERGGASGAVMRTRHPIVLAHGIMGFRALQVAGINFGNYFRGVESHLRERGVVAASTWVGMTNGVVERAQRLKEQIDLHFPTGRVNIIAHSLGGLDARRMITHLGMHDRVASLTTIGTPHGGTYVADWAVEYVGQGMGVEQILDELGLDVEAVRNLTTGWCRDFNERTPDRPGVRYFSLGGRQPWYLITPPFVPLHWLIRIKERLLAGRGLEPGLAACLADQPHGRHLLAFARAEKARVAALGVRPEDREAYERSRGANDGVVPLSRAPWGESFTVIRMDHVDQIGWLTSMNAPRFYEKIVRGLAERGL
jgi:pimeloyl-ACP methyl ester carboxylesterase